MTATALACPSGHAYTPANARLRRDSRGYLHQQCRACDRDRQRARRVAARPQPAARSWTPPPPWTERALCATADPDAWFAERADQAKVICGQCPVRAECLALALATGEEHGIWGGLDADERAALLAGRRTAA